MVSKHQNRILSFPAARSEAGGDASLSSLRALAGVAHNDDISVSVTAFMEPLNREQSVSCNSTTVPLSTGALQSITPRGSSRPQELSETSSECTQRTEARRHATRSTVVEAVPLSSSVPTCGKSEYVPLRKDLILKQGWLLKLSSSSTAVFRRYAVLLVGGDVIFYNSIEELGSRHPVEVFRAGHYWFPDGYGVREPSHFEIELPADTTNAMPYAASLVAPSVEEKIVWIELLLSVYFQLQRDRLSLSNGHSDTLPPCVSDDEIELRYVLRQQYFRMLTYTAPFFVQELIQHIALHMVPQMPLVASVA